jgi:hypothetical protein
MVSGLLWSIALPFFDVAAPVLESDVAFDEAVLLGALVQPANTTETMKILANVNDIDFLTATALLLLLIGNPPHIGNLL